jgi:hypothetical protein
MQSIIFVLKIIGLSFCILFIFHIITHNVKQKKTPKKDMIRSQTEKYKKMLDEIQQKPREMVITFEQKQEMEYELSNIIDKAFSVNKYIN